MRIYEIGEVDQVREAPVTAEARRQPTRPFVIRSEQGFGNIQVLRVVNFVPATAADVECRKMHFGHDEQGLEDLFVKRAATVLHDVPPQVRHEVIATEAGREAVDVDGLVVLPAVRHTEFGVWHQSSDGSIRIQERNCAVHP